MAELVAINQIERQLILYDIFTSFDIVTYRDIQFIFGKVEKRTIQRDIKDLTAAGLLSVKFSNKEQGYIHNENESKKSIMKDNISEKKYMHLKRLQRLAECMRLVVVADPIRAYFEKFPDSSERMRKRDFETLRHIGFQAGYDREYGEYIVSRDYISALDGYGVFTKDGKIVRYR